MIEGQGGERGTSPLTIVTCSCGKTSLSIDASTEFVAGTNFDGFLYDVAVQAIRRPTRR